MVSRGAGTVIHCNGIPVRDYDSLEQQQDNIHIWRLINLAIYRTLPDHMTERIGTVNAYSSKNPLQVRDEVSYVDIRHCYLQVANRLGYINDIDYKRFLKNYTQTKIQVCAAITSMFREVKSDYYNKKGHVHRTITCDNYYLENAQHNIINYSRKIMYNYCRAGMDYYYRNVDGIVVPYRDRNLIIGYMEGVGLEYKEVSGVYCGNGLILSHKDNEFVDCL